MNSNSNDHYSENGRFFYKEKLLLNSDSHQYFQNKLQGIKAIKNTLFVIPSPISSKIDNVLKELIDPSSYAIYIESDRFLYNNFTNYENLFFPSFFIEKLDQLEGISRIFLQKRIRKISFLYTTRGYQLDAQRYKESERVINRLLEEFWKNRFTEVSLGFTWIRNIIKNVGILSKRSDTFSIKSLHTDKDVLVCGAGESLESVLGWIKANRENIFLFVADTAANSLLTEGIIPDAICAMEAQQHNILDFYSTFPKNIPLVCDISSYPSIILQNKGPIFIYASKFSDVKIFDYLKQFIPEIEIIKALGDIGTTTLYLANMITTGDVFFAGIDFASQNGKPHTSGSYTHSIVLNSNTRINSSEMFFRAKSAHESLLNQELFSEKKFITSSRQDTQSANISYLINTKAASPLASLRYKTPNLPIPRATRPQKQSVSPLSFDAKGFSQLICRQISEFLKTPSQQIIDDPDSSRNYSWLYFFDINCPFEKKEDLDKAKSSAIYLKSKFFK
ncbi:MAG: DUF115 domain-containing protein [Spirochaetales bacterium]|nr:DUF115 domain-containing protein [Spirochaetales bacterium]